MHYCNSYYLFDVLVILSSITALKTDPVGLYNIAIVANEEMTLTCLRDSRPNTSINWYFSVSTSLERINISRGSHVLDSSGKFELTGDIPGQHISLKSVQMNQAGVYTCEAVIANYSEGVQTITEASAEVILLASHPTFTTQYMGGLQNKTRLNCSIEWAGNWKPTITWTLGEDKYYFEYYSDEFKWDSTSCRLSSSVTCVHGLITANKSLTCRVHFKNKSPSSSTTITSVNIPDYTFSYIWTEQTPYDKPLYQPKQMSIHPIKDTYTSHEEILCSADGNPKPTYIWTNLKTGESQPGAQLSIDIEPGLYTFQCTATNEIGISVKNIISFRVKEDSQGLIVGNNSSAPLIHDLLSSGFICTGAAGLVVTTIFLLVMRNFRKARDHVDEGCMGEEGETADGPSVATEIRDITMVPRTAAEESIYVTMKPIRPLIRPVVRSKTSGYMNVGIAIVRTEQPETGTTTNIIDGAETEPVGAAPIEPDRSS